MAARWWSSARATLLGGSLAAEPTASDLDWALSALRTVGAPGEEGVLAGTLEHPGPVARHLVLRAMCHAVTCRERPRVDAWATLVAHLSPQPGRDPGAISLVCAFAELFDMVLWAAMERALRPLPPPILGFRPGRQLLEIAGCVSVVLARAAHASSALDLLRGRLRPRPCGSKALTQPTSRPSWPLAKAFRWCPDAVYRCGCPWRPLCPGALEPPRGHAGRVIACPFGGHR